MSQSHQLLEEPFPTSPTTPSTSNHQPSLFYQTFGPGLGLFGEAYILFGIGTLQPLWDIVFLNQNTTNNSNTQQQQQQQHDVTSIWVVSAIIMGMLGFGYAAQGWGRRTASVTTAGCMTLGVAGLCVAAFLVNQNIMTMSFVLFGIGMGGEYPLAACSASETSMYTEQQRRGRAVQFVFSMQGWGIFTHCVLLTLLLIVTQQVSVGEYNTTALLWVWRLLYTFGLVLLGYVFWTRYHYLTESQAWQDNWQQKQTLARKELSQLPLPPTPMPDNDEDWNSCVSSSMSSLSVPSLAENDGIMRMLAASPTEEDTDDDMPTNEWTLLMRNYGMRLVGVSAVWFLWDVAFYGNKLFQTTLLFALIGQDVSLLQVAIAATMNAFVALLGYYGAALLLDRVGRTQLQMGGLLVTGLLFVGCAFLYETLSHAALAAMYMGSSFFGQLGPNATTFLLPAEIFPTDLRTLCHGIAAASGKLGALVAACVFSYRTNEVDMFLVSGYACFAACFITFYTIPETNGLDLKELDRRWRLILDGRKAEYEGEAVNPRYMSYYERNKWFLAQSSGMTLY